jgi:multidrug efflux pump subunit AcrA (membrane-fusion protein)
VTENGSRIVFPALSPGLARITAQVVHAGSATIPVIAPAHVVASISAGLSTGGRIVLFDSPDVTSLYSQYSQSRSNIDRTTKNLDRVKEMFSNQAANAKDLNEAEAESANARTTIAECEAKLRGLGFNPVELNGVPPGTIWLICDVLESQLHEVQQGEDVPIVFSAFPDHVVHGRADAIGEVVDPVTRTIKVRVSATNPHGRILPGMFARVDFGDPVGNVVVLPLTAVVTVEGQDYAFVQDSDRTYSRRPITLASSGATAAVVKRGIADGDRIVTGGTMLLKGLSFGY